MQPGRVAIGSLAMICLGLANGELIDAIKASNDTSEVIVLGTIVVLSLSIVASMALRSIARIRSRHAAGSSELS